MSKVAPCFGCTYISEDDSLFIPYSDIKELIAIADKEMAKETPDLCALSKEMASRYRVIRDFVNKHVNPGQRGLPKWTESMILDHYMFHVFKINRK